MAIFSGAMNFFIPFFAYQYSVATLTGKSDDYATPAFAGFLANFYAHHMQMFLTIRNYTFFYLFTGTLGIFFLFPMITYIIHVAGDDL